MQIFTASRPISELRLPYRDATQFMSEADLAFFREHFVRVDSIEDLLNKPIAFIIGEKGSGKSAFATYFSNSMDPSVTGTSLLFEKTDYDSFLSFGENLGVLRLSDYSNIWECMFLIHAISFTSHSQDAELRKDSNLRLFRELLNSFGYDQPITKFDASFGLVCWDRQAFYSELKKIFPFSPDRSVNLPDTMPSDFRTYLSALRGFLTRIVKETPNPERKHLIFIDGLDVQSFDFSASGTGDSKLQTICISGLVDASWKLNRDTLLKRFGSFLRIVVLLRPDIFERVGLHNMGTKLADNSIFLNWNTKPRDFKSSDFFKIANNLLKPLVVSLDHSRSSDVNSSDDSESASYVKQSGVDSNDDVFIRLADSPWDAVFDRMYVTPSKKTRHSFVEFLYNSFNRPRDLVAFLDIVRITMNQESRGDEIHVDPRIFNNPILRQKYAEYLKTELKDAISFYYSVNDFDIMEKFFEFLSEEIDRFEFSHGSYEKAFFRLKKYISDSQIKASSIYDTPDGFLQFLYEQNIVGAITQGAKTIITQFAMSVRNSSTLRPRVPSAEKYRLHGGVARALYPTRIR